jgi:hypothetical protein
MTPPKRIAPGLQALATNSPRPATNRVLGTDGALRRPDIAARCPYHLITDRFSLYVAPKANFTPSLGQRPRDSWNKKKPALKARFNLDVAASATTAPTPPQTAI